MYPIPHPTTYTLICTKRTEYFNLSNLNSHSLQPITPNQAFKKKTSNQTCYSEVRERELRGRGLEIYICFIYLIDGSGREMGVRERQFPRITSKVELCFEWR